MTWRLGPTGMEAHAQEGLLPFGGIRKGFDSICPEHWSLRRFQICGWSGLGEWEGKDVLMGGELGRGDIFSDCLV